MRGLMLTCFDGEEHRSVFFPLPHVQSVHDYQVSSTTGCVVTVGGIEWAVTESYDTVLTMLDATVRRV